MFREAMKGEPGRHKETDNNVIPLDTPQGNSKAYSISRVQKECDEETVKQVMAGAGGGRNVGLDCPRDRSFRARDGPQNSRFLAKRIRQLADPKKVI